MTIYEVWIERLTLSLRALGIAFMVVVLGWMLLTLATSVGTEVGLSISVALLIGYAGGRVHAWWKQLVARTPKTIQSEEFQARRKAHVPLAAPSGAALRSEADTVPVSENPSIKAFVEREMAASKDDELRTAADLTARQLQQAIEIAEGKVGKERAENDGALVGAVLEVLATNYRLATR
jgi:hypothetical protein